MSTMSNLLRRNTQQILKTIQRNKIHVAHELGPSPRGGTGLFACQNIPKGTTVWKFDEADCIRFTKETIKQESDATLSELLYKGFLNPSLDKFIILEDGSQFANHGIPANVRWGENDETWIADKDIETGSEILFNYDEFGYNIDSDWIRPLCEKLSPRSIDFEIKRRQNRNAYN